KIDRIIEFCEFFHARAVTAPKRVVGGIPMVFSNVMNHRTLSEAHEKCSFYDPYIGEDAGYVQVTRLNGHGPTLIVVPFGKTPMKRTALSSTHMTRRKRQPLYIRTGHLGASLSRASTTGWCTPEPSPKASGRAHGSGTRPPC